MNFKLHDEKGREVRVTDLATLTELVRRGQVTSSTLLFDEESCLWKRASEWPEYHAAVAADPSVPSYGSLLFGEPIQEEKPRAWPLVVSVCLIAFGVLLLTVSIISFTDSAYAAGYRTGSVAGGTFLFGVVALLLWRTVLQKKKGVALLLFSCCFLAVAIYNSTAAFIEAQASRNAAEDIASMVDEMMSSGQVQPLDEKKYGRSGPMVKLVNEYLAQLIADFGQMNKEFEAVSLETIFARETLQDTAHINAGQQRLLSMFEILDRYEALYRQRQDEVVAKVAASDISEPEKRSFMLGFNRTRESGVQQLAEFFGIERSFISKADEVLNFVRTRKGRYNFVGDVIQFTSSRDAEHYNALIAEVTDLAQKEVEWQTRARNRSREQLDKMRRSTQK